jgi:hypothetical protein
VCHRYRTLAPATDRFKQLFERHAADSSILSVAPGTSSHGRSIERLFEEAIMSVLAGWESRPSTRAPRPIGGPRPAAATRRHLERSPVRRPAGLAVAPPARLPVTSCGPAYRRRRLIALILVALATAAVVAGLLTLRAAAADDGVPQRTAVVEVHSGETLWDLAERVAPQSPPQAVVERIRELNGIRGSTVHPGQPLLVPDER